MIFGLPEDSQQRGPVLQQTVSTLLVDAAGQHDFMSTSIRSVRRIGSSAVSLSRARPVLVCCQTVSDKHAALKASRSLKD